MTSHYFILLGILQFAVLVASAIVPFKLNWKDDLASLPKLHLQMYWIYGGYVVLSIVSLATICIVAAADLAEHSILARAFCCYGFFFWGIRVALQAVLDAKPYLTSPWFKLGYDALTFNFAIMTALYAWGMLG